MAMSVSAAASAMITRARRDALRADGAPHDLEHRRDLHERRHGHERERQAATRAPARRRGRWAGRAGRPRPLPCITAAPSCRAAPSARARTSANGAPRCGLDRGQLARGDLAELREAALAHADDEDLRRRPSRGRWRGARRAAGARGARSGRSGRPMPRRRAPQRTTNASAQTTTSVTNVSTRYPA